MPRFSAGGREDASILHADLDSFYASVEQRDDPALRGRPVIVGMGVVLAASYEAKAHGVRTPMNGREALALCPSAVVVRPRFDAYTAASRTVFDVFADTTPLVEGISVDEAFLDVGGLRRLRGTPVEIADRLRAEVRDRAGLPITVGVARTKFLAKVASAVGKPDGLLEVPPDGELEFLHPLPVERLWGVGAVTSRKLREAGIGTVGDLAATGETTLGSLLGRAAGRHLHALSMARDPRPVQVGTRRRSIGSQRALGRRPKGPAELEATVVAIVDRLGKRLRAAERICRTVVLRLRFDDFTRATRSHTLFEATDRTDVLMTAGRGLLADASPLISERGCTLIGLSLTNLGDTLSVQLALPFEEHHREELDIAMDGLRDRFGSSALTRAVLLGRDDGMQVPMLPD
ncbi:DNA polymerase IV [Williamsia sterculiae]|uniref:DNA polymerase IV n=1 Tax=Williamsia sterculiae TaxID=1344003 RepID=A0A1N7FHT1_9NOCA|nr:DNA polymerase IV [Williamsia sterculiae]SIR99912.1 DNA polymerase-4 [Williamsia sterculiae]